MERSVAIKKLGKLLGKSLGYRVDPSAPTSEGREEIKRQLPTMNFAKQQAEQIMRERQEAILAGDAKYQELVAIYKDAKKRAADAFSVANHFKVTVGRTTEFGFFHIEAQGDSWEDVIETLERKQQKAAA